MRDNKEGGSRDPESPEQESLSSATSSTVLGLRDAPGRSSSQGDDADGRPVSADMQQFIGRQLRAVFDDVAKQPIPDRFLELMKQLDGKTSARG